MTLLWGSFGSISPNALANQLFILACIPERSAAEGWRFCPGDIDSDDAGVCRARRREQAEQQRNQAHGDLYTNMTDVSVRELVQNSLIAIAVTTALLSQVSRAQQSSPSATFQVEVNFVDIDAVVTDARGNFVADLTRDDFELFEDGKPQEISTFSLVDIPMPSRRPAVASGLSRTPPATITDVTSNAQPISGRLYVDRPRRSERQPPSNTARRQGSTTVHRAAFRREQIAAVTYTSGRADADRSSRPSVVCCWRPSTISRAQAALNGARKSGPVFQQHLKELELNKPDPDDPNPDNHSPEPSAGRWLLGHHDRCDDFERGHRAQQVLGTLRETRRASWAAFAAVAKLC